MLARTVVAAERALWQKIYILHSVAERDIDTDFAGLMHQLMVDLLVGTDPFFNSRRGRLIALAARQGIPAMYINREFAAAGGLISYSASFAEAYRQAGIYTGRILKGEKPADLPVVQPTKFELVINL